MNTYRFLDGLHGLARRGLGVLGALLLSGALFTSLAYDSSIDSVDEDTPPPALGYGLGAGREGTIYFRVTFRDVIDSVVGSPRLKLGMLPSPSATYAEFDGFSGADMYFKYDVKPGDFARNLDCASGKPFERNLATIKFDGFTGSPMTASSLTVPLGATLGSLQDNATINVTTVDFNNAPASTVQEGDSVVWTVTRDLTGASIPPTAAMSFDVTVTPAVGGAFTCPATITIPASQLTANLTISGLNLGGPFVIRLHPTPYSGTTAGDLTSSLTVTAGATPRISVTATPSVNENAGPQTVTVTLSRPAPLTGTTVSIANDNPAALTLLGSATRFFASGDTSLSFSVQPRDGWNTPSPAVANLTVSATGYFSGSTAISVGNVNPVIVAPPEANRPIDLGSRGEGSTITFSLTASDVQADRDGTPPLRVEWDFSDGTATTSCDPSTGAASVSHEFNNPGPMSIYATVIDKDGGSSGSQLLYTVLIEPAIKVKVSVFGNVDDSGRPLVFGPKKLSAGLGKGTVYATNETPNSVGVINNHTSTYRYDPTDTMSIFFVNGYTPVFIDTNGDAVLNPVTERFDSFFYVWEGSGFKEADATVPVAPDTVTLELGQDRAISAVFSREYRPQDGFGDIDVDALPDTWENQYGFLTDTASGTENPDGDLLPVGANANLVYPATGNNYAPEGAAFHNRFEVRGLQIGLNARSNSFNAVDAPSDEPHSGSYDAGGVFTDTDSREIYGTDPSKDDSDNDGLLDGWEYYFWMNAVVRHIEGLAYDETRVIFGTPISPAIIAASFNPLVSAALDADTDKDGLTNVEEMNLGTNPIHYDTDGDGMCDSWEVFRGLDPLVADGVANLDGDWMARNGDFRHFECYKNYGFDPRTAWYSVYLEKNRTLAIGSPNTVPFTNFEEYRAMALWIEQGIVGSIPANNFNWQNWSTDPANADTDGDLMPDGWEMYVASPDTTPNATMLFDPDNSAFGEAAADYDNDNLNNRGEFHGQESCLRYNFANVNDRWWNKFWPTDPYDGDTDGDVVGDGAEGSIFRYDNGYANYIRGARPGGMMNPCCVDTDMDYLPDFFEFQFSGIQTATGIELGMDGSYFDSMTGPDKITGIRRNFDYDGDGLENYQEYATELCIHLLYDRWVPGLGYGAYPPPYDGSPKGFDWASLANYWQDGVETFPPVGYAFKMPEGRPLTPAMAAADPSLWDTDDDGMDDFYEMYHGLDPLYSLTIDTVNKLGRPPPIYDFRLQPYDAGHPNADPDQDGIPNFEESLVPNLPAPYNHHTDPSPLWTTDISYDQSWVNLCYSLGGYPMYWTTNTITRFPDYLLMTGTTRPSYMFSFESNEGYDTDNDNLQDKQETIGSNLPGATDPLDYDNPQARKALYLDGTSAARTRTGFAHGQHSLRSWTLEIWVRPLNPASGARQVILERPVATIQSDVMPAAEFVRRTFRLGLEWDGMPFVEYENFGKEVLTLKPQSGSWNLPADTWTHLAATMNGVDGKLSIYVNGQLAGSVPTTSVPFTGFITGSPNLFLRAPIVVGAADANPNGTVSGALGIFYNGSADPGPSQPSLSDFYTGWVDEVRIWDGPRSQAAIKADYDDRTRYDQERVIASREESVDALIDLMVAGGQLIPPQGFSFDRFYSEALASIMANGGETPSRRLPPTLLYHYSFDNLPDPDSEAMVPNGFDTLNGRPIDGSYAGVPWWAQANDRSTVYRTYDANPYLFVQWIENTPAHVPFGLLDAEGKYFAKKGADSMYWQVDSTGLASNTPNHFLNTCNPYGMSYAHSLTRGQESHPEASAPERFDPNSGPLYNDMLPLRGAVADLDVTLWDNGTTGHDPFDSDGDGLPDDWETANGFDPYDATGDNGAFADFDGDGLSNYAEFLAGTNPNSIDTDRDGILDFDDKSDNPLDDQRRFSERFTDGDYVEDVWESGFADYFASPHRYDEHMDLDADGWANWAERRVNARPDRILGQTQLNGRYLPEFPTPTITATIDYAGVRDDNVGGAALVVYAYTDPNMDGLPDAVFTTPLRQQTTMLFDPQGRYDGGTFIKGTLAPGSIVPTQVLIQRAVPPGNAPTVLFVDNGVGGLVQANGVVVGSVDYISGDYSIDTRLVALTSLLNAGDYIFASYNYNVDTTAWPLTVRLKNADLNQGYLREGTNYFFAFIDLDGSADAGTRLTWTPGEPAAVADGFVTVAGWDRLSLRFGLTDVARSFARFSWAAVVPPGDTDPHLVTIWNAMSGLVVFERTISAPRTWLHEGDIMAGKAQNFGLNWGGANPTTAIYEWSLDGGAPLGMFTNTYSATLAAPTPIQPSGAWIKASRPEFRFRLAADATEFDFEIRRNSVGGALVYSGRHLAPARSRNGTLLDECIWKFPYQAGNTLPNGQIFSNDSYVWRVKAYSPAAASGSAWSAAPSFRLDVQSVAATSGNLGWFGVTVRYPGTAAITNGPGQRIRVQAFSTRSFNGVAEAEVQMTATGTVTLAGLQQGEYFVRAYVDQNNNRQRDLWETWGYVRSQDDRAEPFRVLGVQALITELRPPVVLTLQDCDTDQDEIPDALEWRMHGASGGSWLGIAGPGPVASSPAYSDFDSDGLNDRSEGIAGTSVFSPDSDGDGISDRIDRDLGFVPTLAERLRIAAAQAQSGLFQLQWSWSRASSVAPLGTPEVPVVTLGRPVTYIVERTDSLVNPDWQPVSQKNSQSSADALELPLIPSAGQPAQGFFRVRMYVDESYFSEE